MNKYKPAQEWSASDRLKMVGTAQGERYIFEADNLIRPQKFF